SGPIHDDPDYDKLIPIMEKSVRFGLTGSAKYTGPNPGNGAVPFTDYDPDTPGDDPYPYLSENPDMNGTLHDVFTVDTKSDWPEPRWGRAMQGSWQAGRLEIVFPTDQPFSKIWVLPSWMYTIKTDVNQDFVRNIADVSTVAYADGTSPGDTWWQFAADYDGNDFIDGLDLVPVSADYGKPIP
ncbi:MAG: hypothetical protein ACE5HR_07765, partial [bacterium]